MMVTYVGLFKKQRIFVKRILKKIKSDALWCEPTALVLCKFYSITFFASEKVTGRFELYLSKNDKPDFLNYPDTIGIYLFIFTKIKFPIVIVILNT